MSKNTEKKLYFFFSNQLLVKVFSESIEIINKTLEFQFTKFDPSQDYISHDIYLICDVFSVNELKKNQIFDKLEKVYLLSEDSNDLSNDNKIIMNHLPIKLISFIHYIINDFTQNLKNKKNIISFNKFIYDHVSRKIFNSEIELRLTEKENEIFSFLITKDISISKKILLKNIWNYNQHIDTHTLETHIYSLRKKLEEKLGVKEILEHKNNGYFLNKKLL